MQISLSDFKAILKVLKEQNIALKVKTHSGWSNNFLQVIGFIASTHDQSSKTFAGVVLSNMSETEGIMINNISIISAFQVERECGTIKPEIIYQLNDNLSVKAMIVN
jgi:hypothetical protein